MQATGGAVRALDPDTVRSGIAGLLNRHPAVGLAVGVVGEGGLQLFEGHGLSDIPSRTRVAEDTVFRIGSITKTFTAIAVMQLWERGLVDLDAPAGRYLRAYRLLPAGEGHRQPTLRHLLTHTAGIGETVPPWRALERDYGESVELGRPLPLLAEYYRGGLRLVAEPGTRFRYGDHGFATLGQIVEDVSGSSLDRYFRERIFDPLGMTASDLLRSERVETRLATGYVLGRRGPRAVTDRHWITTGASSIYSTPRDMALWLAALLGGGANGQGRILRPETLATMFEPQYQTDPRLPGVGLAFFRATLGDRPAIEDAGILPGFDSQIFLAPRDGLAVFALSNGVSRGMMWLPVELAGLLGDVLGIRAEAIRTDVAQHPEVWGDLCGWYRLPIHLSDLRMAGTFGLGARVSVRRGRLTLGLGPLPALQMSFPLNPDDPCDPYAFRIDFSKLGVGTVRVVFSRDPTGAATGVHLDIRCTAFWRGDRG